MDKIALQAAIEEMDLGVMIDHDLKFDMHIESQVNKANRKLDLIMRYFDTPDDDAFVEGTYGRSLL